MSKKSYVVNLPQTNFPMKANSAVREVEIQKMWDEVDVYGQSLAQRAKSEKFVLHDGPPYLSANKIHIGHALNKILKDIVTKYKAQKGYYSPFVPGYDSHGLPIENAVLKEVKGGRQSLSPVELRTRCREFALANLKGQEENFKRLGVWGDWEHPYVTLDPSFEAAQLRVFGKMAEKGYLYKGLKPVYWCSNCETALAEAEVEYADHESASVFVKFKVSSESKSKLPDFVRNAPEVNFVIWTTTTWTLPANVAIALSPNLDYDFLQVPQHGVLIVANALRDSFIKVLNENGSAIQTLGQVKGSQLELIETEHPFIARSSLVILGDHVTTEFGTGAVHTAPGHGLEDFEVARHYQLPVLSPVDNRGVFTAEGAELEGLRYDKANTIIVEKLRDSGRLVHHEAYRHSYPHCWRCKKPVIYRATEQWFASVAGFRDQALKAIDTVTWVPASGKNRIYTMVENRSDWCISRQRAWGVPIPVFYCSDCQEPLLTNASVNKVADVFAVEGSDTWWEKDANYFLGADFRCKCGSTNFIKETDIMDVWFDSGTTHAAVLDARPELRGTPCELYLEGSDQHRGWFQSSLLTSVAVHSRAPYKTVVTHGFIVDEHGHKMSKSLGNVVEPQEVIKQYGADVLRLWVASVNYTDDLPIGKNMLAQLADIYRKLRNTARYLLGNLYDYDPQKHKVAYEQLSGLDKYILHKLQIVITQVIADFDRYEFFKYYQVLQNFCVIDLSSFYFDIVKDCLYTAAAGSVERRAVQTVLAEILNVLTRILVPVAPHLAEDIWQHFPEKLRYKEKSVLLTDFPTPNNAYVNAGLADFWEDMIKIRFTVNKALELARAARKIGSSLEAQVKVAFDDDKLREKALSLQDALAPFLIASQACVVESDSLQNENGYLSIVDENGMKVVIMPAAGTKCARCWKFRVDVGSLPDMPELCSDCRQALLTLA